MRKNIKFNLAYKAVYNKIFVNNIYKNFYQTSLFVLKNSIFHVLYYVL